jgi:hypothetical protein
MLKGGRQTVIQEKKVSTIDANRPRYLLYQGITIIKGTPHRVGNPPGVVFRGRKCTEGYLTFGKLCCGCGGEPVSMVEKVRGSRTEPNHNGGDRLYMIVSYDVDANVAQNKYI